MDNTAILCWNVRGLNSAARRDNVHTLSSDARAQIVCLVETKLNTVNQWLIASMLGPAYRDFAYVPAAQTRGGIIVAAKSPDASLQETHIGCFSCTVRVIAQNAEPWWLTVVYGPQDEAVKTLFLEELEAIRDQCPGPWAIIGDFNLILDEADKSNARVNRRTMRRFRQTVANLQLLDIHLHGRRYTWSNERDQPTLVRLDCVLASLEWEEQFPACHLQALASDASDHCPLLLQTNLNISPKPRFHFEIFWPKFNDYQSVLSQSWVCTDSVSDPIVRLDYKLRNLARELRSWSARRIGIIREQLLMARTIILKLDQASDARALTESERSLRADLKQKCLGLSSLDRTIARQRSRVRFLAEGDANTKYFHLLARGRRRKNAITRLRGQTGYTSDQTAMEQAIHEHFMGVFGTAGHTEGTIDFHALGIQQQDLSLLEQPVTEAEVWNAIQDMPADRAPGPDGYTGAFYKSSWAVIKQDIMAAINATLFGDCRAFGRLNGALIALLPKAADACEPGHYRPITMVHSLGKLISKILALRMAPKMKDLISPNQNAFIRGRSIHDNYKFVQRAAVMLRKKRAPKILLKLDIAKAFDTVQWPFILEVLQAMGFGDRWRRWITTLLSTSTSRILLNGKPGSPIQHRRGVRQGDSLSPLLFICAMEILGRLFQAAKEHGVLRSSSRDGVHFQCSLYADDAILFAHPDANEAMAIKGILQIFEEASGLKTNMAKCSITNIFGAEDAIQEIQQILGCQIKPFPIRYLGLPLSTSRLPKDQVRQTVDAVARRIPASHGPLMAKSGRLVWVKSVLTAIPIYCMIADGLPPWARAEIDSICRRFLWCGKDGDVRGKCMVAWRTCTRPKELGGLGIPDLKLVNTAFEAKWLWLQKTDSARAWAALPLKQSSEAIAFFRASTHTIVGNGRDTLFWLDSWIGGVSIRTMAPTLMQFVPKRVANSLTVAEALPDRRWVRTISGGVTVPATAEYLQVWHAISGIVLNENSDRMVWRWSSDGRYSVRSAYQALQLGSHPIPGCVRVWEIWAPLRVKMFLWLALRRRHWTAERRRRHGLEAHDDCFMCDQHAETLDHIIVHCPFARQLWTEITSALGVTLQQQPTGTMLEWWVTWRELWPQLHRKGADSLFALVAWELWKERNARCFRGAATQIHALKSLIKHQAGLWIQAGAKHLGSLAQGVVA